MNCCDWLKNGLKDSGSKSVDYVPHKSSVLLGNMMKGKRSKKYFKFGTHWNKATMTY